MTSATVTASPGMAFEYISKMVLESSAIVLDAQKAYLVESRIAPILRTHGYSSLDDLVAALKQPGSLALKQEVVEAMTTNETSFFRDIHPFEAMKSTIIPELIKNRSAEREINIWSNACSSGQEVYTIAMLLRENFPELNGWKVRLTGSDLDTQILDRARKGLFNQTEVNRGLPMQLLLKYFEREGIHWKLKQEILDMVEFRQLNLVDPFPVSLPKMDIIFLRNVLIYFSVDTKEQILDRCHNHIRKDGCLFLGGGESIMNMSVKFDREQIGKAVCYRPQ